MYVRCVIDDIDKGLLGGQPTLAQLEERKTVMVILS